MMRASMIRLLLLLPLVFVMSCNKSESPSASTAPANGHRIKIGVSIPAADHGWTAGVGWWAQKTMKDFPDVDWVYATADKPEKQIADIEDMLAQKVDGLVILATESAPLTPVAKEAKQRGVYIVNVDRGFLDDSIADVFIAGDNTAFGRKSAEFMVDKLGGKGDVAILRGIPCTVDTDRFEAAMKVFNQHPGIKILAAQPGMWNQQKALEVTQSYLTQFPHIDAIWASDDDMAIGVERALKEANRTGQTWVLGGAGMKDVIKRVGDNDPLFPADVTYPPAMISAGIAIAVADLRDGNERAVADKIPAHLGIDPAQLQSAPVKSPGPRKIKLDVQLVTPANAKQFYFADSVF